MFTNINWEDKRNFKFNAVIVSKYAGRLLNATEKILHYRLNLPQLVFFAVLKMFLQELLEILSKQTEE